MIESKEEDAFVARMMAGKTRTVWLGGQKTSGRWMWSNGVPVQYVGWKSGEPNNYKNRGENCIMQQSGWNDEVCSQKYHYVCSWLSSCRQGWVLDANTYRCYRFFQQAKNWSIAQQSCGKEGGSLSSVQGQLQNAFVAKLIGTSTARVWLGGKHDGNRGFKWSDQSAWSFSNWNSQASKSPGTCLTMSCANGKWNAASCSTQLGYVCDVPRCVRGSNGNCYYATQPTSWRLAATQCARLGSATRLVSIHSASQNEIVARIANISAHSVWIGASYRKKGWVWGDKTSWNYAKWANGEPNRTVQSCAQFTANKGWSTADCSKKQRAVCAAVCLEGFHFNSATRKCYKASTASSKWAQANRKCGRWGGSLATVHSHKENAFLSRLLGVTQFWIGGKDPSNEGIFEWTDGSKMDFVSWAAGEPNRHKSQERCITVEKAALAWHDTPCSNSLRFVCEMPSLQSTRHPCPENWSYWRDECWFIGSTKLRWQDARVACEQRGGNLAAIPGLRELRFARLVLAVDENVWVGGVKHIGASGNGSKVMSSRRWGWVDGSKWQFPLWAPGQPDYKGDGESCLELRASQRHLFNDNVCFLKQSYMCRQCIPRVLAVTTGTAVLVGEFLEELGQTISSVTTAKNYGPLTQELSIDFTFVTTVAQSGSHTFRSSSSQTVEKMMQHETGVRFGFEVGGGLLSTGAKKWGETRYGFTHKSTKARTTSNGKERTAETAKTEEVTIRYNLKDKILPHRRQQVTAEIKTTTLTFRYTAPLYVHFSCGLGTKTVTVEGTHKVTGLLRQTNRQMDVTFGPPIPLAQRPKTFRPNATCASNPICSYLGQTEGNCCPGKTKSKKETYFDVCCAQCRAHKSCIATEGVDPDGMCCPSASGVFHDCCPYQLTGDMVSVIAHSHSGNVALTGGSKGGSTKSQSLTVPVLFTLALVAAALYAWQIVQQKRDDEHVDVTHHVKAFEMEPLFTEA